MYGPCNRRNGCIHTSTQSKPCHADPGHSSTNDACVKWFQSRIDLIPDETCTYFRRLRIGIIVYLREPCHRDLHSRSRREPRIHGVTSSFDLVADSLYMLKRTHHGHCRLTAKGVWVDPNLRSWRHSHELASMQWERTDLEPHDKSNILHRTWLHGTCRLLRTCICEMRDIFNILRIHYTNTCSN